MTYIKDTTFVVCNANNQTKKSILVLKLTRILPTLSLKQKKNNTPNNQCLNH